MSTKSESKVLTCSYPESGLNDLTPAGVILIGTALSKDFVEARLNAIKDLSEIAFKAGFSHVFNVKLTEEKGILPPSIHKAVATGDAYSNDKK